MLFKLKYRKHILSKYFKSKGLDSYIDEEMDLILSHIRNMFDMFNEYYIWEEKSNGTRYDYTRKFYGIGEREIYIEVDIVYNYFWVCKTIWEQVFVKLGKEELIDADDDDDDKERINGMITDVIKREIKNRYVFPDSEFSLDNNISLLFTDSLYDTSFTFNIENKN